MIRDDQQRLPQQNTDQSETDQRGWSVFVSDISVKSAEYRLRSAGSDPLIKRAEKGLRAKNGDSSPLN